MRGVVRLRHSSRVEDRLLFEHALRMERRQAEERLNLTL
jgi:hypothetical protein